PLLFLTSDMFQKFIVDVNGPRLHISNYAVSDRGRPYPQFHQTGTRYMPARKIVPDRYLSPKWRAAIRAATNQALLDLGGTVPTTGPKRTGGRGRRKP